MYEHAYEPYGWEPKIAREQLGDDLFYDVVEVSISGLEESDVDPVSSLPNLKVLKLHGSQLSDLTPLASLPNLYMLVLDSTPVSDLSPLESLKKLRYLYLNDTKVNRDDVATLQKALPNCVITQNYKWH